MEDENHVPLYKPQGMENKIKVFPHSLSSDFIPCMQTDKYTVTIHSAVWHR